MEGLSLKALSCYFPHLINFTYPAISAQAANLSIQYLIGLEGFVATLAFLLSSVA
jgi:hypothetical protein